MLEPIEKNRFEKLIDYIRNHLFISIAAFAAILIVIAIVISLVTNVVNNKSDSSSDSESTYEKATEVYLPVHKIATLNPLTSTDEDTYYISQLVFSSLFTLDENLNISEDLVSSYTTNSSKGTVSIKLRFDAKFSDGSTLDADDVIYTIKMIKSIGTSSPYYNYVSKIASATGSGQKLTITFSSADDAALDNLVFPIVSSASYKTSDETTVGSGQYKISSYEKYGTIKLAANDSYYGKKASMSVTLNTLSDFSNVSGLLTTEKFTAYVGTSSNSKKEAEDKKLNSVQIYSPEVEYLAFNFDNKVLKKRNIRQAICYAIDTESIVSTDYGDSYILNDSIYYPEFLGTENNRDSYSFDQEKAIELLKKAGYKDRNGDGLVENKNGDTISLTIIARSDISNRATAATEISNYISKLGITTNLKLLSKDEFNTEYSAGNFDIAIAGYVFDKSYNLKELFDKGNKLNYSNDVILKNVLKLETSLNSDEMKSVYKELKSDLIKDVPYYCICYKEYTFMTVANFNSSEEPTFFDRYRGVSNWNWDRTITPDKASDTYSDDSSSN